MGVRRYQNKDGSLTELGKKRQIALTSSDRKATISKGTVLYRVSDSDTSDTSRGKIYVSANKETGDFYINALGSTNIYNTGKAYLHQYVSKTDLKMPDKKTMEKIELGLLKDKAVQTELIDSLMKKGVSREQATKQVEAYNVGKEVVEKTINTVGGAMFGAYYGAVTGALVSVGNPIGGAAAGAVGGGAAGAVAGSKVQTKERSRALNVARVSYGDKNNKVINATLRNELSKKGYNAMKDYNDRRAFGNKGKQAIIVFDSDKNVKSTKISEIKSKDYGQAYARNYLKEHPKSKLNFNDLVKDGEAKYKQLYESGVINRATKERNKRILETEKN